MELAREASADVVSVQHTGCGDFGSSRNPNHGSIPTLCRTQRKKPTGVHYRDVSSSPDVKVSALFRVLFVSNRLVGGDETKRGSSYLMPTLEVNQMWKYRLQTKYKMMVSEEQVFLKL